MIEKNNIRSVLEQIYFDILINLVNYLVKDKKLDLESNDSYKYSALFNLRSVFLSLFVDHIYQN